MPRRSVKFGIYLAFIVMILFTRFSRITAQTNDPSANDSDVATAWFSLQLQLVQETPGFTPPVVSRAFGYSGVALYEALVPGMSGYQTLGGQLNELREVPQPVAGVVYHWPTVANSVLATITRYLFANASDENKAVMDRLYDQFADAYRAETSSDVFSQSVTQGRIVADAIYIWSLTDGGNEGYLHNFPSDYLAPVGAGLWIPTPRANGDPQPAMQPYWGNNRTFALRSGEECAPSAPPVYSEDPESAFYTEVLEVYNTETHLTPEERNIALFWADDPGATATPPGHWISILNQVLETQGVVLDRAAEAYAKVGIALADSFIGCWQAKYQYNLIRPVTVIRAKLDPDWLPLVNTPPFPEYPSGHSVQSAAAAEVLTDLFGDRYAFTDQTHTDRGYLPRSFESFQAAAEEAAISRLYGGIHYRSAIEQGLAEGRCIGQQVNAIVFRVDA